ncbi:MAG: hypothetical protein GY874_05800 [Desulfobacteraceae bacterium]|nr:hypothetical protein [Desulfobacteraceae bacterium]
MMAAEVTENQPVMDISRSTESGEIRLIKKYNRYRMIGFTGNLSRGNFVFKAETAYCWGRSYQRLVHPTKWEDSRKDAFDAALGLEYSSTNRLWTITLEAANKHILQWDATLYNKRRNENAITGIFGRNFVNETLNIEYTLLIQFNSRDTFQKLRTEYKINDRVTSIMEIGGYTSYDEDGVYWAYRNKQRILFALQLQI